MSAAPRRPFLPLDAAGAALWPPGYVPQFALGMASAARTVSNLRAHERVEVNRQSGRGWAGGTLNLPRTPHNSAPPPPVKPAAPAGYLVLPGSLVWRALELIRYHGRPIRVAELAADMRRPARHVRAGMQPWIARGVVKLVDGDVARNGITRRDIALGRKVHQVRVKVGA